jgi:hypothetical protein
MLITRALGQSVVVVDDVSTADIIVADVFHDRRGTVNTLQRYYNTALTIFLSAESHETLNGVWFDELVNDVHISLGHRRMAGVRNHIRWPCWLMYSLDPSCGCSFPPAFHAKVDPDEWFRRPGYSFLLTTHNLYPRPQLFNLMGSLGHGEVDCPSHCHADFQNSEWPGPHVPWPADKPRSARHPTAQGPDSPTRNAAKVNFSRYYKFSITPQNSRTREAGPGFNGEKVPQAHEASVIPIWWGDFPVEPGVFNDRRVLYYNDSSTSSDSALAAKVNELMTSPKARNEWFAEPVLECGAEEWLSSLCDRTVKLIREAWAKVLAGREKEGVKS